MARPRLIWLDAHLPIKLAPWIGQTFGARCRHVGDLGLLHSDDGSIFTAARRARAVFMTKDDGFVERVEVAGPPPRIVWLACGNISQGKLQRLLRRELATALELLDDGATTVRIGSPKTRH